jgi:hypothetical protein
LKKPIIANNDVVSGIIDRIIISNPNEEDSSGDEEDEAMSSGDTNSDLSDSELSHLLD